MLAYRLISVVQVPLLLPFPSLLHSLTQFSFHLTDAPKITNKPVNPNIRLSSGASQTITVRYDQGYPQAKVEWSKDGHLINIPDPRITTANAETKLTLTNNDPGVRGTYGVKVSNGVENDDTAVYFVEPECKLLSRVDLTGYSLSYEELNLRFQVLLVSFSEPLGNVTTVCSRASCM